MVKESAHVMVEPGRSDKILQGVSESCRLSKAEGFISHLNPRPPWDPGRGNVSAQVWTGETDWYSNLKGPRSKNSYMVDGQPLSSTHVFSCLMEDSLRSSVSWYVTFIPECPHRRIQSNVEPTYLGAPWPTQVDVKFTITMLKLFGMSFELSPGQSSSCDPSVDISAWPP